MNNNPLLSVRGVSSGYDASQVLFRVSFDIHPGQVVTLLGRNGMGKSTTIKSVLGSLAIRAGDVYFDGERITGFRPDVIARLGVAIVPEGRQCFPNLTVREHLVAFAARRNARANPWTLDRIYAMFPRLKQRENNMGNQLSGGEQQMLAIGRALSTTPRLLILDEASEGLAPITRDEIWECLKALRNEGQTILVVDKYVDRLIQLADYHVILERGSVVWTGDSKSLTENTSVWTKYLSV